MFKKIILVFLILPITSYAIFDLFSGPELISTEAIIHKQKELSLDMNFIFENKNEGIKKQKLSFFHKENITYLLLKDYGSSHDLPSSIVLLIRGKL